MFPHKAKHFLVIYIVPFRHKATHRVCNNLLIYVSLDFTYISTTFGLGDFLPIWLKLGFLHLVSFDSGLPCLLPLGLYKNWLRVIPVILKQFLKRHPRARYSNTNETFFILDNFLLMVPNLLSSSFSASKIFNCRFPVPIFWWALTFSVLLCLRPSRVRNQFTFPIVVITLEINRTSLKSPWVL